MTIPEEQKIKLESMQIKGIRWMIWNNIEKTFQALAKRLLVSMRRTAHLGNFEFLIGRYVTAVYHMVRFH